MDIWKYYEIIHSFHTLYNPSSFAKIDRLTDLCGLNSACRVLDIGCGRAEFLVRLVEKYGVTATGVELSPFFAARARRNIGTRVPDGAVTILEMDGASYAPADSVGFDLAVCLGASWIFKGHEGTLRTLKEWTNPGGSILVGEPIWLREPEKDYLESAGFQREEFQDHHGNVMTGENLGLVPLHAIVSDPAEWDEYECLQWYAAQRWLEDNPGDPDAGELRRLSRKAREEYLRWGRSTIGWSLYLFRKPVIT
ncbi:class I SAM-dependent methyltransferase [bacterium]|nr:class I SAM-dependent methyltransferase [candidate division CSSED10-310 bacterium]